MLIFHRWVTCIPVICFLSNRMIDQNYKTIFQLVTSPLGNANFGGQRLCLLCVMYQYLLTRLLFVWKTDVSLLQNMSCRCVNPFAWRWTKTALTLLRSWTFPAPYERINSWTKHVSPHNTGTDFHWVKNKTKTNQLVELRFTFASHCLSSNLINLWLPGQIYESCEVQLQ